MYENEKCMPHGLPKEWKCVVHALQTSKLNPLHTLQQTTFNKPSPATASNCFTKPCSNPLAPLEGLTFSALKQKQAGWIQSKVCFANQPIKHTIKGFPRNITKHTKRRRPDHSTNPCGKPSFFPSPLRGTVGVNTNLFRFPLPPWGG